MDEEKNASSEPTQPNDSAPTGGGGGSASSPPVNGRPKNVASLLMGVTITPDWFVANRRANRFYVANLPTVMAAINLLPTKSSSYFKEAGEVIEKETAWREQLNFEYKSSHTQIFPKSPQSGQTPQTAKLFGIAATIIVAMEMAAKDLKPGYNVYDHLRILPAHFFVDHFNSARLEALVAHHNKLSLQERVDKFGAASAHHSFEKVCLESIGQFDGRLLPQLAEGFSVDKYTADKLVEFVTDKFPSDLHVGPVRSSGENAAIWDLGSKNAAPDFRPPRSIPQTKLPPCF